MTAMARWRIHAKWGCSHLAVSVGGLASIVNLLSIQDLFAPVFIVGKPFLSIIYAASPIDKLANGYE